VKDGTALKMEFLDQSGKVLRTFYGETAQEDAKLEAKPAGEPAAETPPVEGAPPQKADKKADKAEAATADKDKVGDKAKDADKEKADKEKAAKDKKKPHGREGDPKVAGLPGLNRYVWDLEVEAAKGFPGLVLWAGTDLEGPRVVPGNYQARLTVGEGAEAKVETASFEVKADPRSKTSAADLQAQYDFLLSARDKLTLMHTEIRRIRQVRSQLEALKEKVGCADRWRVGEAQGSLGEGSAGLERDGEEERRAGGFE
jgi:hypothetical protein